MGKDKLRPDSKGALSLERFAHAKISSYDKTSRKEREFALNAKKVNKYRKLKQRLLKAGKLKPIAVLDEIDPEEQQHEAGHGRSHKGARSGGADADMERILSRAGPAPEDGSEQDMTDDDDMVGEVSDMDSPDSFKGEPSRVRHGHSAEEEGAAAGLHEAAAGGAQRQHAAGGLPTHQHGKSMHLLHAPRDRNSHPGAVAARRQGGAGSGPPTEGAESGAERLEHTKEGKREKHRPPSRLQRIAAEVQAKKEEAAKERERRRQEIEARKAKLAEVERHRKQQSKLLRKRTKHGQPVMKFRMEKILGQLQAEATRS